LGNIASLGQVPDNGRRIASFGITTRYGRQVFLFDIPPSQYYEVMWEAKYVIQAVVGFVTSHGQTFPVR
jgi:hypothetical protein